MPTPKNKRKFALWLYPETLEKSGSSTPQMTAAVNPNRFDLCRSKTALFSLLCGKMCGFYAKSRKKQLRNRRIYAII